MYESLEKIAHTDYQKYLLADNACRKITNRMLIQLSEICQDNFKLLQKTANIKVITREGVSGVEVNMISFVFEVVFRASMGGLYTKEIAENVNIYQHFIEFDNIFALLVAGAPVSFFPQGMYCTHYF
jgi:hypothetical protein